MTDGDLEVPIAYTATETVIMMTEAAAGIAADSGIPGAHAGIAAGHPHNGTDIQPLDIETEVEIDMKHVAADMAVVLTDGESPGGTEAGTETGIAAGIGAEINRSLRPGGSGTSLWSSMSHQSPSADGKGQCLHVCWDEAEFIAQRESNSASAALQACMTVRLEAVLLPAQAAY